MSVRAYKALVCYMYYCAVTAVVCGAAAAGATCISSSSTSYIGAPEEISMRSSVGIKQWHEESSSTYYIIHLFLILQLS